MQKRKAVKGDKVIFNRLFRSTYESALIFFKITLFFPTNILIYRKCIEFTIDLDFFIVNQISHS